MLPKELKTYTIWAEGYAATGQSGTAQVMGQATGKTFKEACDKLFAGDKLYNPNTLRYWGCNLFDNETEARKSFG